MSNKVPKKVIDRYEQYRTQPLLWVKDMFGDNLKNEFRAYTGFDSLTETGLTVQQEDAFSKLGELIDAKLARFYKEAMTEKQAELSGKIGMSIMSGTGTGKDFFTAVLILYFLGVFKDARAAATANSAKQLRNVLWSQIARVMDMSVKVKTDKGEMPVLKYMFEYQSEKVFLKEGRGATNFCEAVTCNATMTAEEQAEVLGGRHAKYMLLVADEATGIPDGVFKPLEGTLTGAVNLLFLIFNPTKTKGFAIDSQYGDSARWVSIRWNSEESEIVTKSSIETMEKKYGRDSNPFRIRVLGLPPLADSDALIPWDWIDEAVKRDIKPFEHDPVIMALDCGAGGDKSILGQRQGGKVFAFKKNNTPDSMALVGWAANNMEGADVVLVDKKGIGHGVYGRLAEVKGWRVRPYDGSQKARNEERFDRRRDEVYMLMREKFEAGVMDIPDDRDFIDQLAAIKVKYDSRGRMHVVTKAEVKREIGHSPDEVDTLAMTFDANETLYRQQEEDPEEKRERMREERRMARESEYAHSWMGA